MTNYFELYDVPVSFHPDLDQVKKKYYELTRRYHPDRFASGSAAETAEALQMTALVNEGFRTLRSKMALTAHILKLYGLLEDEEKYSLPAAFLMEVMDVNELIDDLTPGDAVALQRAEAALNDLEADIGQETEKLTQMFTPLTDDNDLLLRIKDFHFRKKYLLRIKERISKFAAR